MMFVAWSDNTKDKLPLLVIGLVATILAFCLGAVIASYASQGELVRLSNLDNTTIYRLISQNETSKGRVAIVEELQISSPSDYEQMLQDPSRVAVRNVYLVELNGQLPSGKYFKLERQDGNVYQLVPFAIHPPLEKQ